MNSTKCICTIKYKTHYIYYYLMQIMNIYVSTILYCFLLIFQLKGKVLQIALL